MDRGDPYTPNTTKHYYECFECGYREITSDVVSHCPRCHGAVHNIGVARE